jgi:hypothetical protein
MGIRDSFKFVAGGAIAPSRFVTLSTTQDSTVLQATTLNTRCIGISQAGSQLFPTPTNSNNAAGADLDPVQVYGPGDIAPLQIGAGGVTRGAMIRCDATGQGVLALTTGNVLQWVQAIALEAGASGEIIDVLVTNPIPYYPALV